MKKLLIILILTFSVSACFMLFGCGENTENFDSVSTSYTDTKTLTISILNLSQFNIGMFSVIDPATGEQVNIGSIEKGSSLSMECNWPIDTADFFWAMYNEDGELCIDASTNIETATQSVTISISGEETIDDIETLIE